MKDIRKELDNAYDTMYMLNHEIPTTWNGTKWDGKNQRIRKELLEEVTEAIFQLEKEC